VVDIQLASELQAIAIALRLELGEQPFAIVDAKLGALHMLAVENVAWRVVLALTQHPVVRAVVADILDFFGPTLKL